MTVGMNVGMAMSFALVLLHPKTDQMPEKQQFRENWDNIFELWSGGKGL